jgi:hypothetical protein
MITLEKVVTLDGDLINIGAWDFKPYKVEVINNPFPGPMEAPDDWDFHISYREEIGNPLPEGAIEAELEVFFDRAGSARLVDQAADLELVSRVNSATVELSSLMTDALLGLASPDELDRAKALRLFLKDNPLP